MRRTLNLIIFVAVIFLSLGAWAAEKMKQPTVEYSADMVMDTGRGPTNSKVYYAQGGKERQEVSAQGSTQIMITRLDKNVQWIIMPEQKSYMEMSLVDAQKQSATNLYECEVDFTSLGNETVNGVKATKNKVSMSCSEDLNYKGTMWITKDNVMVKMDVTADMGSTKVTIKNELSNLKIAKQDPSLFEIPAGYKKFNMGGMFYSGQTPEDEEEYAEEDYESDMSFDNVAMPADETTDETNESSDTTDKAKGTMDRLKGLFGR